MIVPARFGGGNEEKKENEMKDVRNKRKLAEKKRTQRKKKYGPTELRRKVKTTSPNGMIDASERDSNIICSPRDLQRFR